MKKLLFIVILFLIVSGVFSLDLLSAEFAVEIGWLPQGTLVMYESKSKYDLSNTFYTILGSRVYLWETLFAGGSIDVSMHNVGATFSTEGIDYQFEAGIKAGIFQIFYIHNCIHPAPTWLYYSKFSFNPLWETAHDRIGIKISGKIH